MLILFACSSGKLFRLFPKSVKACFRFKHDCILTTYLSAVFFHNTTAYEGKAQGRYKEAE